MESLVQPVLKIKINKSVTYILRNLQGTIVKKGQTDGMIQLSDLDASVYFLELIKGDGRSKYLEKSVKF